MKQRFDHYKWVTLISFSLMYNFVYLGRFNVNNNMDSFAADAGMDQVQTHILSVSVFLSYAVGSVINGYLADRIGAKKIVIWGGIGTILMNGLISQQSQWTILLAIWIINGFLQSMIWVGGISMLSHWWAEGSRGQGVGIANFFSGISHVTAYLLPILILSLWPNMGWRTSMVIPMGVLLIFVILFGIFAVEKPEDRKLPAYEVTNPRLQKREETLQKRASEGKKPWLYFLQLRNFWWWCAIAMISSICRYGLLNWIPVYYQQENGEEILSESFSNLTLPVGMAFGTLVITWVAGTKLFNNKGIIVTAMAALCGTLVITFPMLENTQSVLVGIFFMGFALYGINGILWVHAIDQGCRVFAGSAAGVFNGFAYFGAFLETVLFPFMLNLFDNNYLSIFVCMELLCIIMVICGIVVSKKNTITSPEIRE